ncbi:diguanylate cyclase [Qipengyuania sp.]|uniref:sensor domain-containing diguanylate cyclase n=1 Tax=Qipengyuania sp. TaxID=2004515 RepID=UPI0035C79F61
MKVLDGRANNRDGWWWAPILTGFAYLATAGVSLYLTQGADGTAALWPPSGIMLAALLLCSRKQVKWHLLSGAVASLLANAIFDQSLHLTAAFTAANVAEPALIAWLVKKRARCRVSFLKTQGLLCFCMASAIGAVASATIATVLSGLITPLFWSSWFLTVLLGILIVTPIVVTIIEALLKKRFFDRGSSRETFFGLGAVFILSIATFFQSSYPLLFLPAVAVVYCVVRLGPIGGAGSVLIVAATASFGALNGSGPQTLIHGSELGESLFLQFYLLTLLAVALPITSLLSARERLVEELGEMARLLQMSEGASHVGHWRLDIANDTLTWSDEVFRIYGLSGPTPPPLDKALEAYHPKDREMVSTVLEESMAERTGFEFDARIIRPDGEVRHVRSRGEIDREMEDGSFGVFGIIQDITDQVRHEEALHRARVEAELAAHEATIAAQTDQLTGIANRRKISDLAERAIASANTCGQPLSVALLDIDHFKSINDRLGHNVGDEVLIRVAHAAELQIGSDGDVGRFGGEEFLIVMPCGAEKACERAEAVRRAIGDLATDPCVTVSVGVAQFRPGESLRQVLQRADESLYRAKNEGRDTVRLAA